MESNPRDGGSNFLRYVLSELDVDDSSESEDDAIQSIRGLMEDVRDWKARAEAEALRAHDLAVELALANYHLDDLRRAFAKRTGQTYEAYIFDPSNDPDDGDDEEGQEGEQG